MDKALLDRWQRKQLISPEQAEALSNDWRAYDQDQRGSHFVVVLGTIGALLLGIAAIVFISANWQEMPSLLKILIMLAATGGSLAAGYFLSDRLGSFPRIGSSLVFLSTLLAGATVAVGAQTYHLSVPGYWLLLVWLLAIAPVAYLFRNAAAQLLAVSLLATSAVWMLSDLADMQIAAGILIFMPMLLYLLGTWHHRIPNGGRAARWLRLITMHAAIIILLILAFNAEHFIDFTGYYQQYGTFFTTALITAVVTVFLSAITMLRNPTGTSRSLQELLPVVILTVYAAFGAIFPHGRTLSVLAHALIIGLIIHIFRVGYESEDVGLINFSTLTLGIYLIGLYIDMFYELLQLSVFLFIGGALLLGGGFFLERKRRDVKEQLTA